MRDVIWTIIGVWVLYKLYNAFFNRTNTVYQKHEHHHYKSEPELKINIPTNRSTKKTENVEYTDFEEIK